VCPQCGTRHEDWDHGGPDEEDRYIASVNLCVGCQVIAEKQEELQKLGHDLHGKKVSLVPVEIHAALQAQRELIKAQRGPRSWDDE
jgi:hypothetical protein